MQELKKINKLLFTTVTELLETNTQLKETMQQKTKYEKQSNTKLSRVKNELSLLQKKHERLTLEISSYVAEQSVKVL